MKKRLHYLIILAALLTTFSVYAQQAVRGTLRSTTGDPLPGATITIKGTGTSVTSDANGQFSINAPTGSTLVITYIGYATQEVVVNDANPLSIQLQSSNQELQQLVVIGYQTVRKRDLTGATGVVNMTDVSKITAQSVGEAIQGVVP